MKLELLLSTMKQKNFNKLKDMGIFEENIVVINQCELNSMKREKNILWINSNTRGLSKSRNMALSNAMAEICLFSDDDLIYKENFKDLIIEEFSRNKEYDIITFQVSGIDREFKKYPNSKKNIGFFSVRSVSSVEIAFRLKPVIENKLYFNESFGAGAKFNHGEENIFLYECLKKGLKILYVPIKIAEIYVGNSTWFRGYNRKYFISNGAIFYKISNKLYVLFIIRFAIFHYLKYKNKISFYKTIKYMFQGVTLYKKRYNG